ncbi:MULTISPECIES: CRISPR-associated endonuclease Cas3'' [Azotobacter]|uniref:CRISPR-associated endonuclease Cas3'' n=1 Tax=Azotobacter TaxID=352 RepID=UPI0000527653|nr:CRISPR-associated endonuclease Cas3'' [Azotobacter vinelandii]GLK60455.1 CRISPR-associated helicase/endonuclease Cas3 [Azotobacter vinelandii]SFY10995.1 CRISPR-associated helicase, Cas3 family [Azotobacter vinelandii]
MSIPQFFAHSGANPDKSDWQPLAEHLKSVGHLAAEKAGIFGGQQLAGIAGLLHDLGKYTDEFQRRISGDLIRVDHATRGAMLAVERYGALGRLLAYGIAGHHSGLANGRDPGECSTLEERLKGQSLPALLDQWQNEIQLPAMSELGPLPIKPVRERQVFQLAFLARMLFSCLVDADFLDTEAYYDRIEQRPSRRSARPSLPHLQQALNVHLAGFRADSPVNRIRADILGHVRQQAVQEPGLFSLTVPTGGGKTLASLAFALDHAIRHGLRRIIYVIPFTSIVEQNAAVFRKALGEFGEQAVLEHHSAFSDNRAQDRQARDKLRLAMENWDAPIIVTTAVQFFESLYADRPSRCRKLHNIAGSVIILDEAQTLPLRLLRPCVTAIDELALNYRCSPVLCTATQPALQAPEFRGGLQGVRELAPQPEQLFQRLVRVQVRQVGILSDAALQRQMAEREQVLCIVNNRRHARALYESIAGSDGARHLTTLMCARHRSQVLAEVRQRLHDGQPCRLVATSLIEAGVDVDFPTVLRAEAGLDSIAQAAGRCNREGLRALEASEVLVFQAENPDWKAPQDLQQFAQAAREVLRNTTGDPLAPGVITRYFQHLYWQKGDRELDAKDLLAQIESKRLEGIPFEMLAREFRMIDSMQCPVIIPFDDEAQESLRALEFADGCGELARQLQPYIVQLPRQGYDALLKAGAIQPVAPERYAEQFMQLVNPDLYHAQYGLHWDNPTFMDVTNLVI